MYQQINLSDHTLFGQPGPIPQNLFGLSDDVIADIGAHVAPAPPGMAGQGWWPVIVTTPTFDPLSQVVVPPATYTADPTTKTVTGTATIRAMTTDEFNAANPVPEFVTNYQARSILVTDGLFSTIDAGVRASGNLQAVQAWDYANNFYRASPFIALLAGSFSMTDAQIDDIFRRANKVQ